MKALPPTEPPMPTPMAQVADILREQAGLLESIARMMVLLAETMESQGLDGTARWYPPEGETDGTRP